ncbi:hypothetical protein GYMLUDRAFT_249534 [Collybiopsis luxurians FD-317 M1]|uniref:Uncharacterized protein n=1 Tax=Collybiopsis luxurians FD-317 M1 TaxID=944289 RepID=A0A0D0AV25_9AGAR|nr:hypothetical protein GYMLUDRAFT_249534 [Collybiopsis luxurians FD-317 M1]
MTPGDRRKLFALGGNTTFDSIDLIISAVGWGAQVLMTYVALYYLNMKPWTSARKFLFIICTIMLLDSTVTFSTVAVSSLLEASSFSGKYTNQAVTEQFLILNWLSNAAQNIALAIGDSVVVWRAWVLLPDGRLWKAVLTILMIANVGLLTADCVVDDTKPLLKLILGFTPSLDWASLLASFIINLFVTLFIVWKWW